MQEAKRRLQNYEWAGFRPRSLPMPQGLAAEGLDPRQYHRLAVAYGLSFFFDDIGRIVPPSKIEDIEKTERIKVIDSITKDMV